MPTDAAELHRALRALVRLQEYRERVRTAAYGVSPAGADALDVLARRGPLPLGTLAAELVVDKSTASRLVALLEERGWVLRTDAPGDRRAMRIHLTDEGRALQLDLMADASWEAQAVLGSLGEAVRAALPGVLAAWTRVAGAHAGAGGG